MFRGFHLPGAEVLAEQATEQQFLEAGVRPLPVAKLQGVSLFIPQNNKGNPQVGHVGLAITHPVADGLACASLATAKPNR